MIKEKIIVSSVSLVASLSSYFYAKTADKDAVPYVMVGGFIGAILGEVIAGIVLSETNEKDKQQKKESEKENSEKK